MSTWSTSRRARTAGLALTAALVAGLAGCTGTGGGRGGEGRAAATGPGAALPVPGESTSRPPAATPPAGTTPAAGTPSPAGTLSTAPAARPVAVPPQVMLTGPDWPGGRVQSAGTKAPGQTQPAACQERTAYPSDRYRLAARSVGVGSDEPESGGAFQVVVRYAPGRGPQVLAEIRRVLAACREYQRPEEGGAPWRVRHVLAGQGFAGDDALLIRQDERMAGTDRDWSRYLTVVRLGDAVVTTETETGEGTASRALALRLAATGARRAACLRATC